MPAKKKVVKKPVSKNIVKKKVKLPVNLSVKKPYNKSQIIKHLTEVSCLRKVEVALMFETLINLIEAHIKRKGPGEFVLPGLAKFRVIHKPATKARDGINPFTGQPTVFAAKPARNVVKIRPLKKLKDMAL